MKKLKPVLLISVCLYIPNIALTQNLNWGSLKKETEHIVNINAGAEHGVIFGLGYGYQLKTSIPIILNAEYSFPSGKNLTDDFKTKIGGQIRLYHRENIYISAKLYSIFRRYQSDFVRLLNFGSDLSVAAGYYKPKWFAAAEAGFDKAIVTHFKHHDSYKNIYPLVKDGWYEPATGGNFYYGIQTGFSFKRNDIYLKAGKIITQDFKTKPLIPFAVQLGYNVKISS